VPGQAKGKEGKRKAAFYVHGQRKLRDITSLQGNVIGNGRGGRVRGREEGCGCGEGAEIEENGWRDDPVDMVEGGVRGRSKRKGVKDEEGG